VKHRSEIIEIVLAEGERDRLRRAVYEAVRMALPFPLNNLDLEIRDSIPA
jgi:hypothetical protein